MKRPLLQTAQAIINRQKHAENMARLRAGLPPLDRRHGRRGISTPRPCICRRMVNGREVFDSNIRTANAKRTFCGRYGTRAEADAAAAHYLATGERPVKPRHPRKPYQRRVTAPKPPKPVPAVTAARGGGAERLAMLRRVWAERLAA